MSDRKTTNRVQQISKYIWKLYRRLTKGFVTWLLRATMISNRRRQSATGFVLPTTIFLILVVTLTAGALSYRAFNSSTTTIGNVQSRAIYNAATPAIDRARAKLDFLFTKDPRLPGGVPGEEFLISMMRNDGLPVGGTTAPQLNITYAGSQTNKPYDLIGEERVDLNGNGSKTDDNAWAYTDEATGNLVVYGINAATPNDPAKGSALELLSLKESEKAAGGAGGPYVRNGPLSNSKAVNCPGVGGKIEQGWYEDNNSSSILRKRFQINAFVLNPTDVAKGKPPNFTTLEFMQDRKVDRGNKWGAWFQYDMEIHSGGAFNWNGAMHTEGNLLVGGNINNAPTFTAYLISSPNSCVFLPISNSEISVRNFTAETNKGQAFTGVLSVGKITGDNPNGSATVHEYNGDTFRNPPNDLTTGTQWKTGAKLPSEQASDPQAILTKSVQQAMTPNLSNADAFQKQSTFETRFKADEKSSRPYVDDLYRADNRWGPKVDYSTQYSIPSGTPAGTDIPATNSALVGETGATPGIVGLDGYWERRTFNNSDFSLDKANYTGGMRILVGERLELGNPFGWVAPQDRPDDTTSQDIASSTIAPGGGTSDNLRQSNYTPGTASNADPDTSDNPGDPLNPPFAFSNANRAHEARQRRALRDNLAAVQATAIYHYTQNNGTYPVACLVSTAHPGSPQTLQQSVNFTSLPTAQQIAGVDTRFDFFYGKGTNGWEFAPPAEADLANDASPIGKALRNLANFSGDPDGAFPPKQETNKIHPDPNLTMWGNFSNLRRALQTGYASLSPADKSYLHTAGCTLSALAYNINQVQNFDPSSPTISSFLQTALNRLANFYLKTLMDGSVDVPNKDFEVLPKNQLATYDSTPGDGSYDGLRTTPERTQYNPRDYDRVTPDMILAALQQKIDATDESVEFEREDDYYLYQLAVLVHEHYQLRRDRTYGFRPSPAANTWNYNPYVVQLPLTIAEDPNNPQGKVTLWSSACDPNIFNVSPNVGIGSAGVATLNISPAGTPARNRLFLSRLCGTVIPPGAVHDFPGDNNYPARKDTNTTNNPYIPTPAQTYYGDLSPNISSTANQSFDITATTLPASVTLNNTTYGVEKYKLASVAPKFPSLYYIFPEFDHNQNGAEELINGVTVDHRQPGDLGLPAAFQPWKEPYLDAANSATFRVVNPDSVTTTIAAASENYGTGVALVPTASGALSGGAIQTITALQYKAAQALPVADKSVDLGQSPTQYTPKDINSWALPKIASVTQNNADTAPPNLIRYGDLAANATSDTKAAVPFLDRVLFNGREWLPSRVLDIDLEMLRKAPVGGNDTWLPVSGIVYAFREDARREDAISRPGNAANPTNAKVPGGTNENDPALVAPYNLSIKPVDYFADPERRVHGFRLRRGDVLKRDGAGIPPEKNIRGITFVSDNLAYIMGNFNRHQTTPGGTRLEEFTAQLPTRPGDYDLNNFYRNRTADLRDDNFADKDRDLWRPAEILADSVTLLSSNFCDGSAIDTFMTAGFTTSNSSGRLNDSSYPGGSGSPNSIYGTNGANGAAVYNDQAKALFGPGCTSNDATSFLNQNRPGNRLATATSWTRENPSDPLNSPVKVSRNGNGLIVADPTGAKPTVAVEYNSGYISITDDGAGRSTSRPLQLAPSNNGSGTTVNAILVNGIIPSRRNQPYGGLHNFPRFLENWVNIPLRFAGSFLQLNFSTYSTGPYDQDIWEPQGAATAALGSEETDYYAPPVRAWGYDVALQLAPASPAATRFTVPSSERNEFYSEPAANDPYINKMCNALKNGPPAGADLSKLNCPT